MSVRHVPRRTPLQRMSSQRPAQRVPRGRTENPAGEANSHTNTGRALGQRISRRAGGVFSVVRRCRGAVFWSFSESWLYSRKRGAVSSNVVVIKRRCCFRRNKFQKNSRRGVSSSASRSSPDRYISAEMCYKVQPGRSSTVKNQPLRSSTLGRSGVFLLD